MVSWGDFAVLEASERRQVRRFIRYIDRHMGEWRRLTRLGAPPRGLSVCLEPDSPLGDGSYMSLPSLITYYSGGNMHTFMVGGKSVNFSLILCD